MAWAADRLLVVRHRQPPAPRKLVRAPP
eukprot:ctg_4775.g589